MNDGNTDPKLRKGRCLRAVVLLTGFVLLAMLFGTVIWKMSQPRRSLSWAAMAGNLQLLKQWEAKGESLNAEDPHAFNWTPLMAAIFHQQTNIIHYLVSRGVNLNLQDRNGNTALIWAVMTGDTNTVRLLLEHGADVTIKDRGGADVFGYANGGSDSNIMLELLNRYSHVDTNSFRRRVPTR